MLRFFMRGGDGYLIMEFVRDKTPTEEDFSTLIPKLVELLDMFRQIHGSNPGPLGGGASRGPL